MPQNPLAIAFKGKGLSKVVSRGASLLSRYGLTTARLDEELRQLVQLTQRYDCRPTLPITSVVLQRNPRLIQRYQAEGVEFAIHGYRHVDYSALDAGEQHHHLRAARRIFDSNGIRVRGFRAPYLRRNAETLTVLNDLALGYDASPAYAWEVLNGSRTPAYEHVLEFFHARPATDYPVVPHLRAGVVQIPYSLPDDESLVERLALTGPERMSHLWVACLRAAHNRGELFALGLHPARTRLCYEPLRAVLAEARLLTPSVWIARLDEIAEWWRERLAAAVTVHSTEAGDHHITVTGPSAVTVLVRGGSPAAEARAWVGEYQQVMATAFALRTPVRPVIGLTSRTAPEAADFLRQQGYVAETEAEGAAYSVRVDQPSFSPEDQRRLLEQIETSNGALVKLSRWPNGAASALAITGDIDALTLWDYGLRFVE